MDKESSRLGLRLAKVLVWLLLYGVILNIGYFVEKKLFGMSGWNPVGLYGAIVWDLANCVMTVLAASYSVKLLFRHKSWEQPAGLTLRTTATILAVIPR